MNKRITVLFIVGVLLFSTACIFSSLLPNTSTTATKLAGDLYATQTAVANMANLQEIANATSTKMAQDLFATQTMLALPAPATSGAPDTFAAPATFAAPPTFSAPPTFAAPATVAAPATATTHPAAEAVVNIQSINVRSGPGTVYPVLGYALKGDKLTILGQAYNCGWLKVKTPDGKTGWVATTYVTYTMACSEIASAPIPPAPTQAQGQPTGSGNQPPSCDATATITITNETGVILTLSLVGPANYSFNLGSGDTTLSVCPGSYSFSAYGCSGGSLTGSINSGEHHYFYCS